MTPISVKSIYEGDLELHTDAKFLARGITGNEFHIDLTISSLAQTIEGIEIECENATLSYPLPGQGYALLAETVETDVLVHTRGGGETYKISPAYVPLYPSTKFQMFYENWRIFLEGINDHNPNWSSAAQSRLTTKVIEACSTACGSRTREESTVTT
jgi:hypothetical protein